MVELSPMAIFITIEGTVNRQGRDRLPAKVWEKCELVTGSGAVILKAPRQLSLSSRNLIAFTISSIWIQERPDRDSIWIQQI